MGVFMWYGQDVHESASIGDERDESRAGSPCHEPCHEHARMNGTYATHASHDKLIGGWITVSITALATNASKQARVFFLVLISR